MYHALDANGIRSEIIRHKKSIELLLPMMTDAAQIEKEKAEMVACDELVAAVENFDKQFGQNKLGQFKEPTALEKANLALL